MECFAYLHISVRVIVLSLVRFFCIAFVLAVTVSSSSMPLSHSTSSMRVHVWIRPSGLVTSLMTDSVEFVGTRDVLSFVVSSCRVLLFAALWLVLVILSDLAWCGNAMTARSNHHHEGNYRDMLHKTENCQNKNSCANPSLTLASLAGRSDYGATAFKDGGTWNSL